MHELAIAQKLIESAVALLPPEADAVTRLRVQLGALAGLSEAELRFGFEVMARDTACADAELQVEAVPAVLHCPQCGVDFGMDTDQLLVCPTCGSPAVVVVQGKELIIASMDVSSTTAPRATQEAAT